MTYRHQKNGMLVQSIFSLSIGRSDQGCHYGFSTYNIHINNQYRVYLDITNLTIVLNEVRYIPQNMNVHSNSLNYRKMTLLTILSALFVWFVQGLLYQFYEGRRQDHQLHSLLYVYWYPAITASPYNELNTNKENELQNVIWFQIRLFILCIWWWIRYEMFWHSLFVLYLDIYFSEIQNSNIINLVGMNFKKVNQTYLEFFIRIRNFTIGAVSLNCTEWQTQHNSNFDPFIVHIITQLT